MNKPLEGIRVLTLEQFGAGPYGTMFLAELGAEVIKVEAPEGDPSRQVGPYRLGKDDSEYFQAWNLGKKSVTLDLKSAEGRREFEELVRTGTAATPESTQAVQLDVVSGMAREMLPKLQIDVIDTLNVSMCHGWMVIEAARAALLMRSK